MKNPSKTPALNPYVLTWAEFFPSNGAVTKHDIKQFDGYINMTVVATKTHRKLFRNKTKAIEYLTSFNKKLDKSYTVRLFTDKQLSMAKAADGYRIHYTRKQWQETFEIG